MMQRYMPEGWLYDTPENQAYIRDIRGLFRAIDDGAVVEARAVVCDSAHDLYVDLCGIRGCIPREEAAMGISDGSVRDIAIISRVNKIVCFKIADIRKNGYGEYEAVLSRRAAQEECAKNRLGLLEPGEIIDAKITHLDSFGAFADIGCGIASLIPIDSISVSRISHPSDRFFVGQRIKAVVKDTGYAPRRITLSHRELLGTWEENAMQFAPGDTVAGIIRSIESYGIFVELTPNLAGLAELRDDVYVGQHASVFIKSIIPEKMKVKLIIVDSFDADFPVSHIRYYIDGGCLKSWTYSPQICSKLIETVF